MPQGEGWGRSPVDPTLAFLLRLALRAVSRLLSEVGIHVLGSKDRETSRYLALVLLAKPSILYVPKKLVFAVFIGLDWY